MSGIRESESHKLSQPTHLLWLVYSFFLCSGWSALIFQVVWQRVLFRVYGVDTESTTYVVTAFMLGLGLGSLLGGQLSARFVGKSLWLFCLFEAGIGCFGFFSITIFEWVAQFTAGTSHLAAAFYSFLMLLIPTLLMGATLPVLVVYLSERNHNVGESVSSLYLVNTMGAALGALSAGRFMMGEFGLQLSSQLAAGVNLTLAASLLGMLLLLDRRQYRHLAGDRG